MSTDINNPNYKFVIVGGGTAGWFSALFMRVNFPLASITVVESSEIGILGAGEGTTLDIVHMLEEVQIPVKDVLKHANGTFKSSIKFTNWNGDGESFHHSFGQHQKLNWGDATAAYTRVPMLALEEISNNKNLDEVNFTSIACELNKVKFSSALNVGQANSKPLLNTQNGLKNYNNHGPYALHFNANKIADHLRKVATTERNITLIDDIVDTINSDETGNITSLGLKNSNKIIECNFVFDCSGFKRLIIGKHFKSEWVSYTDYLPVNKAIAFTLKIGDTIPPYTESIAMKYGWAWKIPLQDRYGCGYVHDSRLISEEDVKKEIKEYFGEEANILKSISFEPGTYKKVWIKNCLAVGLSSGFIEPLEATAIHMAITTLHRFVRYPEGLLNDNEVQKEKVNAYIEDANNDILDFIRFHYITKRTDTPFWKNFSKRNKLTNKLQAILDTKGDIVKVFEETEKISYVTMQKRFFTTTSWTEVGAGLHFFNSKNAHEMFELYNIGGRKQMYEQVKRETLFYIKQIVPRLIDHRKFINSLIEND